MSKFSQAHALVIGIANYQHINKLPPTITKDAQDIYDLLIDPQYCGYPEQNVEMLLDEQATGTAIQQALTVLAQRSNEHSTVFIYISSHGENIPDGLFAGTYLLPVDVRYAGLSQTLAETSISGVTFTEALRSIPAKKIVVAFDCCHAAGIGQPKSGAQSEMKSGLPEHYYAKLAAGQGRVIIASSRETEVSWVLSKDVNSLFTKHLLEGLRGKAVSLGGVIRIFDLFDYVQPRVTEEKATQHPVFKAELEENFPIALSWGGRETTSPSIPTLVDNFKYDLFISYYNRSPDKTWVQQVFVPALKAKGLCVCVDYICFRWGRMLTLEMARAIEESRYTVAILSPHYLQSSFAEFENVLAQHVGLEKQQIRLLALIRQACTPRLGIRATMMLDMSNDSEFDLNLARFVYQLRVPLDE